MSKPPKKAFHILKSFFCKKRPSFLQNLVGVKEANPWPLTKSFFLSFHTLYLPFLQISTSCYQGPVIKVGLIIGLKNTQFKFNWVTAILTFLTFAIAKSEILKF